MKINDIRKTFLTFFEGKGHKIVSSAPMVIKNDPTLYFTNAGMNQFKDFFLGFNEAKDTRVANTQKCLRASGKHNDLEEVGVDTYHHTMFEMLGNWSFGDYFKEEAIAWAWELLTEVYKVDIDRIYVTVFEGDQEDKTSVDQESIDIWKKFISEDRILLADKKDNFWEMGSSGPCGPCSEIHVDIRSDERREKVDGKTLVNKDDPQVIEVWNLVFMEYNRKANKELEKLPATHVDTGMGLERLAMVLQGKQSNYDIDLFTALIAKIESISGVKYGADERTDIAMRVIADHIRAIAFSIADGQLPSNAKAGYVIRRILRRAVRYGYQTLGMKEPFLNELLSVLSEQMGDAFVELKAQKELISKVIQEEEKSFFNTLATGLQKLDQIIKDTEGSGKNIISGVAAFELFDTFGFPKDLTQLIAKDHEMEVDLVAFEEELRKQRERSQEDAALESGDWIELREDDVQEFVGYDLMDTEVVITQHRKLIKNDKTLYQLVFNITPFYAEGGGQVGDTGFIEAKGERIPIISTKRENNLIVHFVKDLPKNPKATFRAHVNISKRALSEANHSATHLLHHVLREVLGDHVEQKGSLVSEKVLRFDFSHFGKVSEKELEIIEDKVNELIKENIPLIEKRAVPMEIAKGMGAMALFGEKYGDLVRVIQFGPSVELCGGTHVEATGDIRLFKIISEGSVASGIRRIEAISSEVAQEYFKSRATQFDEINDLLNKPKSAVKAVEELLDKNTKLSKEIEKLKKAQVAQIKKGIRDNVKVVDGVNVISEILDLDGGSIKDLCFQLKGEMDNLFAVIGGKADGKATLSVVISDDLAKERSLHAGNLVREAAPLIKGGGGGQPFFATAGGKDSGGLTAAIDKVKEITALN